MADKKTDTAAAGSDLAPDVPERSVLVMSWLGIILAASASVTFNINHDLTWLVTPLAVIAGVTPPGLSALVAHVASAFKEKSLKTAVFIATAGAMAVSSIGTTKTLSPGDGFLGGLAFSLVADGVSLLCLWGLMRVYSARAEHKKWAARQGSGTTGTAQGQPGTSAAAVPAGTAAGSGNQPGQALPVPAVPVPAPPVPAPPVPGTGSAARPEPAAGGVPGSPGETGQPRTAAAAAPKPAASRPASSPRPPAATRPAEGGGAEPRDAVTDEIAARPQPLESTDTREERALAILAEFRRRTGVRMTNQELARALGVRKTAVVGENGIRNAIKDREEAEAA
jgi:hypothetical protein